MCGCPNMEVCRITGNSYGLFSPNNTVGARSDTSVVILGENDVTVLMKLAPCWLTQVHSWTGTCNTNAITDTSALTKQRVGIKTGFSVNPYKGNSGSAKTALTLYSDKHNRSNWSITWSTSPVAFGPSQTKAKNCFVTFCGCCRLFFSPWQPLSPFSLGLASFHNMLLLTPALGAAPPRAIRKVYVYFARYTFGNTITL